MAGSSPAMTENGILAAPTPYALRVDNILRKIRNRTKLALMNSPALSPSKIGGSRLRDANFQVESERKIFSAKIPRNPLIRLVSDERIQGNPNKSKG
jgi:hypothetical protein